MPTKTKPRVNAAWLEIGRIFLELEMELMQEEQQAQQQPQPESAQEAPTDDNPR